MAITGAEMVCWGLGVASAGWLAALLTRRPKALDASPGGYWDVVYVDDNGEMLLTTLHVLGVDTHTRRVTAWCSTSGRERQFKLSKIVKAQDLRTGRRVNLLHWVRRAEGQHSLSGPVRVPHNDPHPVF